MGISISNFQYRLQNSTKHKMKISDAVSKAELGLGEAEPPPPTPPPALSPLPPPPSVSAAGDDRRTRRVSLGSLREWEATPKLPSRVKQPYYQPGRRATLVYAVDESRSSGDSDKGLQ